MGNVFIVFLLADGGFRARTVPKSLEWRSLVHWRCWHCGLDTVRKTGKGSWLSCFFILTSYETRVSFIGSLFLCLENRIFFVLKSKSYHKNFFIWKASLITMIYVILKSKSCYKDFCLCLENRNPFYKDPIFWSYTSLYTYVHGLG